MVIGDGSDATTSGAPGDSTWLLQAVARHSWPHGALVAMNSASAAAAAQAAGVGGDVGGLQVGAVLDTAFAEVMDAFAGL